MDDKSNAERKLTGEQVGEKLLESIAEMKAGKTARLLNGPVDHQPGSRYRLNLVAQQVAGKTP